VKIGVKNKDPLAEQFVGQQLRATLSQVEDPTLFYWQRTGGRQGEIDYLIQHGNRIIPIEIKSGTTGALVSYKLLSIPLYLAQLIPEILSQMLWNEHGIT